MSQPNSPPVTITYNATDGSYTFTSAFGGSTTFTNANSDGEDARFIYYKKTEGSFVRTLDLYKSGSANSQLQLTYVTYGFSTFVNSSTNDFGVTAAVGGIQTTSGQVPTTGGASYTGAVDGYGSFSGKSYHLLGSSGSLNANFATGAITTTLTLKGTADIYSTALGTTNLGSLTGNGTIGADRSTYAGTLAGSNGTPTAGFSGQFKGAFYGPTAQETGYVWRADPGIFSSTDFAAGVFVGKQ